MKKLVQLGSVSLRDKAKGVQSEQHLPSKSIKLYSCIENKASPNEGGIVSTTYLRVSVRESFQT